MASPAPSYRILGVDPGTNYTGYGVLEVEGQTLRAVTLGDIDLHKLTDPYEKLHEIFVQVGRIIDTHKPREVAFESPFFESNVQSVLKLGRAQGVAMSAALSRGIPVFEYAPTRIKQSITGRGAADKEQVARLVEKMLCVDRPKRLDATDGLAVALCHHFVSGGVIGRMAANGAAKSKSLGGGLLATSKRGSSSWEAFLKKNPERKI